MKQSYRLNLLWACLLPLSVLVLGVLLDRTPMPYPISPAGPTWAILGARAFNAGQIQRSILLLSLAAVAHDLSPEGWIMLGDAYQSVGDLPTALQAWQHAGQDVTALERRLGVHRRLRDYLAAIADLQALTALQPEDADWAYQLGLLLAATQPDQALPYLVRAAALSPAIAERAQTLQKRIQAAQSASQLVFSLLETGRALADLEEWELAAEAFRRATLLRPDYAEAYAFLGEALQHIEIPEGKPFSPTGLAELEHARLLDPNSLPANMFLALYWRRQGKLVRSQQILEDLAKLYEDNPVVQIELGNTLAERGDPKTALLHYLDAVQLAPDEPAYWQALTVFSVSSQYQLRQVGLPAARQLLQLGPNDPVALDLMGQALFLLEDPLNAERFFLRAIYSGPAYGPARLHLAQVYLLRGATSAARQELSEAILLAPGTAEAEYALRLLQNMPP